METNKIHDLLPFLDDRQSSLKKISREHVKEKLPKKNIRDIIST
jgi:hypothetical protein